MQRERHIGPESPNLLFFDACLKLPEPLKDGAPNIFRPPKRQVERAIKNPGDGINPRGHEGYDTKFE
jgi:hypothetical protein